MTGILGTGSSRGIGAAIREQLEARCVRVIGHSTSGREEGEIAADFSDPPAPSMLWEEALRQADGEIDVLVNNAANDDRHKVGEITPEYWDERMAVNLKHQFFAAKAVVPAMRSAGGGSIINMSSIASSEMGVANRFAYGASKAAVIGLTKCLAADFIKDRIRCNAICPGTVQSPSLDERIAAQGGNSEEVRAAFIARQPMGRIGTPEEIAALAAFLAADESAYTTGAIFVSDGGMTM